MTLLIKLVDVHQINLYLKINNVNPAHFSHTSIRQQIHVFHARLDQSLMLQLKFA